MEEEVFGNKMFGLKGDEISVKFVLLLNKELCGLLLE
jgi:hypothetical protein